jgi:hypothetical protein
LQDRAFLFSDALIAELIYMEGFGLGDWAIVRAMSPFPGFGLTGGICGGVTGSLNRL